jgi:hypothetical protein
MSFSEGRINLVRDLGERFTRTACNFIDRSLLAQTGAGNSRLVTP